MNESIWAFICENFSLGNISQVAVILSAFCVAWQACSFRNDYRARNEHSAFHMSYQLAKYYAETILPRMGATIYIIREISKQAVPLETFKKTSA